MGLFDIFRSTKPFTGSENYTVDRASKGQVKDWYSGWYSKGQGSTSDENLDLMLSLFSKDPVVNTALTTRADGILASGYTIEGSKTAKKEAEKTLEKLGFGYSFLRQAVLNGLLYRHAFLEVEKTRKKTPVGLHILETTQMEIKHNQHGEIDYYLQRANSGDPIQFSTEEVSYLALDKVSTKVWGEIPLRTLYRTVATKNLFEEFIKMLAETNSFRQVIETRMNDEDIGSFLAYYRDASSDPFMPLVIKKAASDDSEYMSFKTLRDPDDLKKFIETLEYLRTQMLMVLKVPPILVGLPDNSNRSNSDAQIRAMNIANESDRKQWESFFNDDLFPKLGLGTVRFSWNPIDKRDEKTDVEMAEKLINMGADPKAVEEFLRNTGLELPARNLFSKPQPSPLAVPDDAASRPSRQRADMQAEMGEVNTGGDASTRDEQVR